MANSIDSGQPLRNVGSAGAVGKTSPAEKLEAAKERGPLSPEAHGYVVQAKQDVQDVRQIGASQES